MYQKYSSINYNTFTNAIVKKYLLEISNKELGRLSHLLGIYKENFKAASIY